MRDSRIDKTLACDLSSWQAHLDGILSLYDTASWWDTERHS